MTSSDLTAWAWAHKEGIIGTIGILLGWSAHPPTWLVRLRCFPFARAAAVLRWIATGLVVIAGEVHSETTEAPSALPTGAGPTTTPSTEQTP